MKIKVKKFSTPTTTPPLATPGSACFDLFSAEEKIIPSRCCVCIKTGFAIPKGYFGKIHARSSWAKRFTGVGGGVMDSDFRGDIVVLFHSYSDNWY